MTTLRGDILNRVRRLPKPSQASEALQPLFEAISNSLHAIEDKYGEDYQSNGLIVVTIINHNKPDAISIVVADDGVGIDDARFEAFCTTDTDYKIGRGGKGVGRLLWLDAFERISVKSVFERGPDTYQRSFSFQLSASEQIVDEEVLSVPRSTPTGTIITFTGIRNGPYRDKFTTQPATFVKHLGSHFFADFILGQSSSVAVDIDGATTYFPEAITSLLVENRGLALIETPEYGILRLSSFICNKSASANFEGLHQIHLVANGRTVSTRKIDGLLGIGRFGEDGDRVFHGCAAGDFLNDRVNQERTQFNFDETVAEDLVRKCALYAREHILRSEIEDFDSERLVTMKDFLAEYPSFGFDAPEELLVRTPKNAIKAEQFAQALIPIRIRRDKERSDRVRDVVRQIADGTLPSADIAQLVRYAANDVRAEEQRQLTEYVLRRKVALDVLDVLIRRVRKLDDGTDHHLESTLHQFICPMRVRGDDPEKIERSDHDLWVVDERLTFARYFASDVSFRQIVEESRSKERMDVMIFDRLHGLGIDSDEPLRRIMLVEFKKPGRRDYDERYSPLNQISRYISELKTGDIYDFRSERIRVANDCVFYCYVIADIVGNLDLDTSGWRTTSNGRGRIMDLSGKHRGSIEIVEWRDLLADAKLRNHAFIDAAGIR